jgi:hypothetical protein
MLTGFALQVWVANLVAGPSNDERETVRLMKNCWAAGTALGLAIAVAGVGSVPAVAETDDTFGAVAVATPETVADAANVPTTSVGENAIDATVSGLDVTVPVNAADGISVTGETRTVSIGLPFASKSEEAVVEHQGVVSYDNNNGSTTLPIVQNDGSVQINTIIDNESAPTEYAYPVSVPFGGKLQIEQGGVSVLDADGGWIAGFLPAWAKDAKGVPVATHYEVRAETLVQVVEHRGSTVQYPVVADPWLGVNLISHWWWTGAGSSRAVHIAVTPMMGVVTEAIAAQFGWDEASSGIGSEIRKATYEQQFKCHALGKVAIFFDPGNWDLEVKRGTVANFARMVTSHCNW